MKYRKLKLEIVLLVTVTLLGGPGKGNIYAEETHPRLFFNAQDLPRLKAKITNEPFFQKKFNGLKSVSRRYLAKDYTSPTYSEWNKGGEMRRLAFTVLLMDPNDPNENIERAQFAAKCREGLLTINEGTWLSNYPTQETRWNWDGSNTINPWSPGGLILNYSLAYDWMVGAGELTGGDREKVRSRILFLARNEFERVGGEFEDFNRNYTRRVANKRIRALAGVGTAALAFPDQNQVEPIPDPENLLKGKQVFFDSTVALRNVIDDLFIRDKSMPPTHHSGKGTIPNVLAPDGTYLEGPGYQVDAFSVGIPFLLAYKQKTGINYFTGEGGVFDDRIMQMFEWYPKILMPNNIEPTNNDQWWGRGAYGVELTAQYAKNPDLHHWYFEQVRKNGGDSEYIIPFYDLPSSPPPAPDVRTEFYLDTPQAIFRDKWGTDATYMMMVGRDYPVKGHHHSDQTSFVIFAKGAYLALDPGYGRAYGFIRAPGEMGGIWINSAFGHNLVMVDSPDIPDAALDYRAEGAHPRKLNSYTQIRDPASIKNTMAHNEMDYAEAHLDYEAVNVKSVRSVAFVRHKYFVMEDSLVGSDGSDHDFSWRIHFGGGSNVGNLKSFGNRYSWTMPNEEGEPVTLDVDFLKGPDSILSRNDGPTNYRGGEMFDHTYLMAKSRDSQKTYLNVLTPRYNKDAPYVIQNLIPDKMWKIQVAQGEYDLVVSQPDSALIEGHGLKTDAQFLIVSFSESEEGLRLVSVLSKGGTSINIRAVQDWAIQTVPNKVFYIEDFPPGLGADPGRPYTPLIPSDPEAQASHSPQELKVSNGAFYPLKGSPLEIFYETNQSKPVQIRILNVNGEEVATILRGVAGSVAGTVTWDGKNESGALVASGTYLVAFEVGDKTKIRKVVVIK